MKNNLEISTLENIGNYIEKLDLTVYGSDRSCFNDIINKYCDKVDPNNELTIFKSIQKMDKYTAKKLLNELLQFKYKH